MRSSMTGLVSLFRTYVSETGTAIFTDDRIEQLLDANSSLITFIPLVPYSYKLNGTLTYTTYVGAGYLEGTPVTKVFDWNGNEVTDYTLDQISGVINFNTNQNGSAYYYNSKAFNFMNAVSDGWLIKAGWYADNFDFKLEGRSYNKSQVVSHCREMADYYKGQSSQYISLYRGDMC